MGDQNYKSINKRFLCFIRNKTEYLKSDREANDSQSISQSICQFVSQSVRYSQSVTVTQSVCLFVSRYVFLQSASAVVRQSE